MSNKQPNKWRVSDAHGLCIVEDWVDSRMVADFTPKTTALPWKGTRQDAELIVQQHNGWAELEKERDLLLAALAAVEQQSPQGFQSCCTCIGQQLDIRNADRIPDEHTLLIHRQDQYIYVCTQIRIQIPMREPQIPTCIYQDGNWNRDRVRNLLEPVDLWEPGRFGVWTLPGQNGSELGDKNRKGDTVNWKLKHETKPEENAANDAPGVQPPEASVETLDNNIFLRGRVGPVGTSVGAATRRDAWDEGDAEGYQRGYDEGLEENA